MKKYRSIDAIRGISALLIVYHHVCGMMRIPYNWNFGDTIVLFFFILSGFHITITWKDKIQGHSKEFIIKRCSKIFPIQWLMTLLFVLCDINIFSAWAILFHFTLMQSLIPFWEIYGSMNAPTWFLSSLFICYLFTPIILKFVNKSNVLFATVLIFSIILFTIFIYILPNTIGRRWLVYINPFARLIDFSVGVLLGVIWSTISNFVIHIPRKATIFTILELATLCGFMVVVSLKPIIALNNYPVIRYPLILLIISTFTLSYGFISKLFSNKVLSWLGNISISIYMIHFFILHYVSKLHEIPIWSRVILAYLLVLFMSYIVNLILPYVASKFTSAANAICKRFN